MYKRHSNMECLLCNKKAPHYEVLTVRARGRTRTGTVSPPGDFESPTSTNSITRALK